jgi:DNA-binding SARP family transcriptional activator
MREREVERMDGSEERTLHIQLLGGFRLFYGDDPITSIDTSRPQSLLAYLLLHRGAPQSRHRVAFLFWPDSPESQALTNLRNLLYLLRRDLPDADRFLSADRNTLRWRSESPFDFDVARFEGALGRADEALDGVHDGGSQDRSRALEALEHAVLVYEGDLLPSCYADWIVPERERLRQAFEGALERLTQLLEDQQEYGKAIRYAQQLLRHDPLQESSYRRLMRLRALSGDRAGALRTYHKCAAVLEGELDLEPSPVTREMYQQLLALEEEPTSPPRTLRRMTAVWPLVGRHEAWAELRETWRIASAGRPHFVLISGEAGVGKTRLAEELVQWGMRQGITTATARCYASQGELAYAPTASWLRELPRPRLEPIWLTEVARILPELLADWPDVPPPGPLAETWQRRRFFEALARSILGSDRPRMLFIDALQWCDRGTLEWLHYLVRYDLRARLLVVGALRPGEADDEAPLSSLLHALRRDEQLTEIELDPLTKGETSTLAAHVAERDLGQNLIDCLFGETEGNPLFIVETVRAGLPDEVRKTPAGGFVCVPRPLPSRIRDALMAQVDQLSPSARGLVELAATIGREFTFDVLSEATDAGEVGLVRGLDELWQRRIVREQGQEAYDFSHDKLREVIYAELSEARRRMLHRHVARALERVYADNLDSVAARVAAHYEQADEPSEAIAYYQQAAQMAERMQIAEDAARYRERASALLERTATGKS